MSMQKKLTKKLVKYIDNNILSYMVGDKIMDAMTQTFSILILANAETICKILSQFNMKDAEFDNMVEILINHFNEDLKIAVKNGLIEIKK